MRGMIDSRKPGLISEVEKPSVEEVVSLSVKLRRYEDKKIE